jgi:hypothetical protein
MAATAGFVRGLTRLGTRATRSQFVRDFVQGAAEDELKERMFPGRDFQTGPPTAGGGLASILRKMVSGSAPPVLPHTNRELIGQYQSMGIPPHQAVAVLSQNPQMIDSRTLQNFMSRGILSAEEMELIQREQLAKSRSERVPSAELLAQHAQDIASLSTADFALGRIRDRD